MFKFLTYEEFMEASLPNEFDINIGDTIYTIIRTYHLRKFRPGDNKPKDFKMTKSKYTELFTNVLGYNPPQKLAITATWSYNNKSNAISFNLKDNLIQVFGCILGSTMPEDNLYKEAQIRLRLKDIKI